MSAGRKGRGLQPPCQRGSGITAEGKQRPGNEWRQTFFCWAESTLQSGVRWQAWARQAPVAVKKQGCRSQAALQASAGT